MYSVFFGKPKAAVATPEESAAIATESLKKDDENMDAKMPEGDVLETNDVELKEEQINEHPIQKNENTEDFELMLNSPDIPILSNNKNPKTIKIDIPKPKKVELKVSFIGFSSDVLPLSEKI